MGKYYSPMSTVTHTTTRTSDKPHWRDTLRVYAEPASLRMLSLGFSAGLPLLLVFGTLSFWLREAGVDRSTIGQMSWVGVAFGFKWAWAPLVDRLSIPFLTRALGRRRSWLLLAQAAIVLALCTMALTDPRVALTPVVWCAIALAFASATQDIALDAFRIESGDSQHQAALSATYMAGYRLAMIWAGAGALWIAAASEVPSADLYQYSAWRVAYLVMALSMLPGMLTVIFSREPAPRPLAPARNVAQWLEAALLEPFAEFFKRYRWHAALVLALIASYRVSDVVMGVMANPFYVDMGYTKSEVATVTKVYGVVMTLLGAFVGGALALRLGVLRVLMLGAVLSAGSNVLFAWLSFQGHNVQALIAVISADNLSSGIATAAFVAYLSSLTNVRYSATQYALFSSMMVLLPKTLAGFSGHIVDAVGYPAFFVGTACMGIPVLVLIALASRLTGTSTVPAADAPPVDM